MNIEPVTHCSCGRYLGPTRIEQGLSDCTYCSAERVKEESRKLELERRSIGLNNANRKIV